MCSQAAKPIIFVAHYCSDQLCRLVFLYVAPARSRVRFPILTVCYQAQARVVDGGGVFVVFVLWCGFYIHRLHTCM